MECLSKAMKLNERTLNKIVDSAGDTMSEKELEVVSKLIDNIKDYYEICSMRKTAKQHGEWDV